MRLSFLCHRSCVAHNCRCRPASLCDGHGMLLQCRSLRITCSCQCVPALPPSCTRSTALCSCPSFITKSSPSCLQTTMAGLPTPVPCDVCDVCDACDVMVWTCRLCCFFACLIQLCYLPVVVQRTISRQPSPRSSATCLSPMCHNARQSAWSVTTLLSLLSLLWSWLTRTSLASSPSTMPFACS